MLYVEGVSKSYSREYRLEQSCSHHRVALSPVTFSLQQGDVLGLLGLNGAGKSTLLKGLAGVFPFSRGEVECSGVRLGKHPCEYRARIGYQPERVCLPESMTVREVFSFLSRVHLLRDEMRDRRFQELCSLLSLSQLLDVPCGELSKGERQRVGFFAANLHGPALLLLDEPMSGLDPRQMREFRSFIRRERESRITVLSTHLLGEVLALCNKALILHEGRVVAFRENLGAESPEKLEQFFLRLAPASASEHGIEEVSLDEERKETKVVQGL
ncbi:ABC transporter ATP-binding protein [bacterium]|nr:ABC transporter ATP-binding protein [bacterium]